MARVGFIGLGTMGLPMAQNLVRGGHAVAGFDIVSNAVSRFAAVGGQASASATDAARGADIVITMLPNATHVRTAVFGDAGIAQGLSGDAVLIEMSTIHPLESDAIREELATLGFAMMDAPVGRSAQHAIEGKLLIMVGAASQQLEHARPVLSLMGETIVDCGGPGLGCRMKVINNFMSIVLNVATAEALTLAEAIGLDVPLAIDVMTGTPAGQGHMQTTYPAKVMQGDLSPGFMVDLAHKDLGLALDLAAQTRVPVSAGAAAREVYSLARSQNRGSQDWTGIYAMLRELAGLSGT